MVMGWTAAEATGAEILKVAAVMIKVAKKKWVKYFFMFKYDKLII